MHISGLTGSQVWLSSSRSLTDIGTGALAPTSTVRTSLAASAGVDLRTSSGIVANLAVAVLTGAAATGSISIQVTDGTNQIQCAATGAAANSPIGFTGISTNGVGMGVKNNDGAVAGFYAVAAFSWTI